MDEIRSRTGTGDDDVAISMLTVGSELLRRRRLIGMLALIGAVIGLVIGLTGPRLYTSSASFIPQGADAAQAGGLAAAASQFGIRLPGAGSSGGMWGPSVYVDIIGSRTLLQPLALDSFVVAGQGSPKVSLLDLLKIRGDTPAIRMNEGVKALQRIVQASEDKDVGAVDVTVTTRWPTVSLALARQLIDAINAFNLQKRKSQATAEREFAEARAAEAEQSLHDAENRLSAFMEGNRVANAPQLALERERLQRDVELRQQVYTTLVQSREEARLREVRDMPVITMLEDPQLPAVPEPRKSVQKAIFGALAGAVLGMLIALFARRIDGARRAPSDEARAFFELVGEATPRLLKRATR